MDAARREGGRLLGPALALLLGCQVDPLDFGGKVCSETDPCPSGWQCDRATQRCKSGGSCSVATPACSPAVVPSDFHPAWSTPSSIRWEWSPPPDLTRFVAYEVITGEGAPGDTCSGPSTVWTSEKNPELGLARAHGTGSDDPIRYTVTDGHRPDTPYWAVLRALDTAGCAWVSPAVVQRTMPAPNVCVPLFADGPGQPATSIAPPCPSGCGCGCSNEEGSFDLKTGPDAYAGDEYVEFSAAPDGPCGSCEGGVCCTFPKATQRWENLRLLVAPVPLAPVGCDWDKTAYVEMQIAFDGVASGSYGSMAFGTEVDVFSVEPYPFRENQGYQKVQIPLSRCNRLGSPEPSTFGDGCKGACSGAPVCADLGASVQMVGPGRILVAGDRVRLDEAFLCY